MSALMLQAGGPHGKCRSAPSEAPMSARNGRGCQRKAEVGASLRACQCRQALRQPDVPAINNITGRLAAAASTKTGKVTSNKASVAKWRQFKPGKGRADLAPAGRPSNPTAV